jgi:hypothetical protein
MLDRLAGRSGTKRPARTGVWAGRVSFALRPRAEVAPEMLRRSGGGVYAGFASPACGVSRGGGAEARPPITPACFFIAPDGGAASRSLPQPVKFGSQRG